MGEFCICGEWCVPVVKGFFTREPVVDALLEVVVRLTGTWTARGLPWYGPASLGMAAVEVARPTRQRPRMLVSCMVVKIGCGELRFENC